MPTYPIFYSIQNEKDSSTNVFSLNFSESNGDEFPLDLQNGNYHIRFKIQCNEVEPKMFAWIDPSNLEARAPIINNAVYVKILQLTKEGDSKLYNKQKIMKVKASIQNQQGNQQLQANQQQPKVQRQEAAAQQKLRQATSLHNNIHHSNSDPDLVHNKHMKSTDLLEPDHKDQKTSQFKQKSTTDIDQPQKQQKIPPQKNQDLFEDDDFGPMNEQKPLPPQDKPKSGVINFFDSDDENQPTGSQKSLGNNNKSNNQQQQYNNYSSGSTGQDLFFDDSAPKIAFQQHENLIIDHNQAPVSEFEELLKSRESEYIINGEIDSAKLIKIKAEISQFLQDKRVQENEEGEQRKRQEQIAKKDAKEKLEQKVKNWKEQNGTRKDIRTLLSTLQNVLWTGANWAPVSFFDLSTEESLKSTIKKVLIKFHPDRNRDSIENKYICEQVIDEIKQAQKEYESKQQK